MLSQLGKLEPPWLRWAHRPFDQCLQEFALSLDQTRPSRGHALAQQLAREVSVRRGRASGGQRPIELVHPAVAALFGAADVQRLREGEALVLDPQPAWLGADELRVAERELRAHVRRFGKSSDSSCNTGAVTSAMPLLGDGFDLSSCTQRLLRLLAAVPALIEQHGWPRPLLLPPLLQLATYSGRAHYSRHFDSNPWETANRREITILLYLNVDWCAARQGGCLRLHPFTGGAPVAAGNEVPPVDVEPVAGRLVLFQSRGTPHEVLPCTQGERLALTLWVEHAEG